MATKPTVVICGVDDYICNIYSRYIVEQCTNMKACKEIRVTAERAQSMEELKKIGAKDFQIDYKHPESFLKAFEGADWVVVCPEMRGECDSIEMRMQRIMDAVCQCKVGGIVMISSIGAESKYECLNMFSTMEKNLMSRTNGIQCVILRGSMLFRELLFFAPMVRKNKELCLPMSLNNRFAPMNISDMGDATIAIFQGKAKEKVYTLTGPTALSGKDLAEELAAAIGIPIRFKEMTISDFEEMMKDAPVEPRDCKWPEKPTKLHVCWMIDHFRLVRDDKLNMATHDFKKLTNKEPRSIVNFFKEHAEAFRN